MNKSKVGIMVAGLLLAVVFGIQANRSSSFGKGAVATPVTNAPGSQPCEGVGCLQVEPSPQMSLMTQVVVYYFHGNARCSSCYKIEQYAKEAVEQNFADEMKTGKIVFKRINVEQAGNGHFVNDYQLYTKSIVISLVKDGKQVGFKNLEKVWALIRDQNKFNDYVREEVKPFLGEL